MKMPRLVHDLGTYAWMSLLAVAKGGSVSGGLHLCLSWECGDEETDIDMCMRCPSCNVEVREDNPECGCVSADGEQSIHLLTMDVADTGAAEGRCLENMVVKVPVSGRYTLSISRYTGPPVSSVVSIAQFGHLLAIYRLPPNDAASMTVVHIDCGARTLTLTRPN